MTPTKNLHKTCCKQCSKYIRIVDHYRRRGSRIVECTPIDPAIKTRLLYHGSRSPNPDCQYYRPRYITGYTHRLLISGTYTPPTITKQPENDTKS
ncbi:MAG: hypothetical protein HUJ98_14265 [Bacteroidaceae bacterium]|nr:hypothetical protein [Bacteroidaceae bacterium]